jgi:DNA-directed RNA polymerase specialized sigma24 family protein
MRAWRKLKRLHPEGPFLSWFLGIVARQCHDQVRGRWWQVIRMPAPTLVPPTELTDEAAIRRALPARERQVLVLRLHLDLPWSDVAAAARLTEAGARTRYYRALKRLRPARGSQEVST